MIGNMKVEPIDFTSKGRIKAIRGAIDFSGLLCGPGVYFLMDGEEVIYIGKSLNPFARIGAHVLEKDFDGVFVLPVDEKDLTDYEGALIVYFKPRLNGGDRRKLNESLTCAGGNPWRYKEIIQSLLGVQDVHP